jgi:hypothetical protein
LLGSQEQQERQEARQDLGDQTITGQALEVLEAEHLQQPHLTAEPAGTTLSVDWLRPQQERQAAAQEVQLRQLAFHR